MARRKQNKSKAVILILIILILACLIGFWYISNHPVDIPGQPTPTMTPTAVPTQTASPTQSATTAPTPAASSGKELKIHFINIGQGDAVLLTYDGENAMIDAGKSTKEAAKSEAALDTHLNKIDGLEWLLATHQDSDHIGLARHVMESEKTDTFYDNGNTADTYTYTKLMTYLTDNNINYKILSTGDTINDWDNVKVTVVSSAPTEGDDVNDDSIVLLIEYGRTKIALTGDISKDVETEIGKRLGDVDILKVAHHGSKSSSSSSFLKSVKPEVSVISVGENTYGHPTAEAIDRLDDYGDVYRTDEFGCVEVVVTDSGYKVQHCEWA
ncbi:MAG TPA: MBL fold metallo-hydrolase [Methanocorpusculum sp.]|nr:MBL fold metallo-hydrolase [Methanocorpusculum sp.]